MAAHKFYYERQNDTDRSPAVADCSACASVMQFVYDIEW